MQGNMQKGNVLVIGSSGVGKSTLINAVMGSEVARAAQGGGNGITQKLTLYENEACPFRVIDTIGFTQSPRHVAKAIKEVQAWTRKSRKEGDTNTKINVIWFCIDGTSGRLFPETIKHVLRATTIYKTVPIVTVITKSYSIPDREGNIEMVRQAFNEKPKDAQRLRRIIPVVAAPFSLNEEAFAPPEGITELIEVTNQLMPEGMAEADKAIRQYQLTRKRALAHSLVVAATASASAIGFIEIPFVTVADAILLTPLETGMINALASIYGISKDEESKTFFMSIIEVGTVATVAKAAIAALKAIPALTLPASALNAVVAGVIVAALGEGSVYLFEQIYLGNKSIDDIDWAKKVMDEKFAFGITKKVEQITGMITENMTAKDIGKIISAVFAADKKENSKDKT